MGRIVMENAADKYSLEDINCRKVFFVMNVYYA